MEQNLIRRLVDSSLLFIAIITIPLNVVIYYALIDSVLLFPRFIPFILAILIIVLALLRNRLPLPLKTWFLISLLFAAGCFNLLLGLLDIGSLWFIMAIIFTLFISKRKEALYLFIASFVAVLAMGLAMMARVPYLPLDYNFENCHYSCVAIRILHFLILGFLTYRILSTFISTIRANIKELQKKNAELVKLNMAIKREMDEKQRIQKELLDAVMVTEEKERKRLAGDLHDGLGPVLSAINLYYQAYIDASEDKKKSIEGKLKDAIERAMSDISRISHNISPHILENYGLDEALTDFVNQVNSGNELEIIMDIRIQERFNLKRELAIYRTITELINNTLKHAEATNIEIKVKQDEQTIFILYTDNGRGFNVEETLATTKGMGLQSIRSRMESLGGSVTYVSSEGKGMTVEIEVTCHNEHDGNS